MRHHIRQILKRAKNVNSILSKTKIEDKAYYLVKWRNKLMPPSWVSHQILEAQIEKVKQQIEEVIDNGQKEVLNEDQLLDRVIQNVRNYQYSKSQMKILKHREKNFEYHSKQKLKKISVSKCCKEQGSQIIASEFWQNCLYSMKQSKSLEIIGKAKIINATYYLVKYLHFNNPDTFRWENLYSLNVNKKFYLPVQQFDEQHHDSQLPFIKQNYIQYKENLIQMLQNKSSRKVVLILGKKYCYNCTFYLVKFNNTKLQDSKWVQYSEILKFNNLLTHFNRKQILKRKTGQFIFIDRNQIENQISKQNKQTNEQHTHEKNNASQSKNIQELERQVDQLEQKFYRQIQDISRLVNEYQKNYLNKILYGQPEIQEKLSENYLNFRTIFKQSILPMKQDFSFQYSNEKDESSEEIKSQDDIQSLTTQIGESIQQKQSNERIRNVVRRINQFDNSNDS